MKSILSIVAGSLFVVITTLILQLIALFLMVAYKHLEQAYPFFSDISGIFRYLLGIPIVILIMFIGGYIAARIAQTKALLHSLIVGVITAVAMTWLALENANLTTTGIVIFVLMIVGSLAGGRYWQGKNLV